MFINGHAAPKQLHTLKYTTIHKQKRTRATEVSLNALVNTPGYSERKRERERERVIESERGEREEIEREGRER